jgi:hypothetical protein
MPMMPHMRVGALQIHSQMAGRRKRLLSLLYEHAVVQLEDADDAAHAGRRPAGSEAKTEDKGNQFRMQL